MFKRGFTLAEVLIALTIVGVVAALTVPTFVSKNKNQAMASQLSVTVNAVENALTTMLAQEGVDDLSESEFFTDDLDKLNDYLKVGKTGTSITDFYPSDKPFRGIADNTPSALEQDITKIYQTKGGAILFYYKDFTEDEFNTGTAVIGDMAIDVNGTAAPNRTGRDVFYFLVGADGSLYPYGGGFEARFVDHKVSEWDCNPTSLSSANSGGIGCTGRLVENNYKVDY